jgi:hypothetical protein
MVALIVDAVWIGIPSHASGFGKRDHVNIPSNVPVLPIGIDGNFEELRGQSRIPISGSQRSAGTDLGTWFPFRTKIVSNVGMPVDIDLLPFGVSIRYPTETCKRASNRSSKECDSLNATFAALTCITPR